MLSGLTMPSLLASTPYSRQVSGMNCIGPIARANPSPSASSSVAVDDAQVAAGAVEANTPNGRTHISVGRQRRAPVGAVVALHLPDPRQRGPRDMALRVLDLGDPGGVGVGLQRDDRNFQDRRSACSAQSRNWSAGRPLACVSTGGTGSPAGGGTPSGMNRLSCQVQLDAMSIAVAPITATARNQRLGDTTLPYSLPSSPTIVPRVSDLAPRAPASRGFHRLADRDHG